MFVRLVNALLGLYLFMSAFLWPRGLVQFTNVFLTGLLVMGFGVAAILGRPHARWVNFGLGVWLFVSALALPTGAAGNGLGGLANQLIVAVLLATTSLFPAQVHYQDAHGSA
jgi:hypothetical protein